MAKFARESAREREVLRYDGSYVSRSKYKVLDTRPGELAPTLLSSADSTLTSLAQLAAFRLGCSRALVSLFDRKHQVIVAEATRTLPLQPNLPHRDLWLCGTKIPRSHGICEHVLLLEDLLNVACSGKQAESLPVGVVGDLALDRRFCHQSYITEWPSNRFYAGVPLCSPAGIHIGVLCVFDETPRHGLDQESQRYLQDLSVTMMGYLESRRTKSDSPRNERMVQGLCGFVEGRSSIAGRHPTSQLSVTQPVSDEDSSQESPHDIRKILQRQEPFQISDDQARSLPSPPSLPVSPKSQPPIARFSELAIETPKPAPATATATISKSASKDKHLVEICDVYEKAARIIREATEVDGVVFLDASVRSFGGLVSRLDRRRSSGSLYSSSSEEDEIAPENVPANDVFCNVFGSSTVNSCNTAGCHGDFAYEKVPDKVLRALLRRYPEGKVFHFEEDGSLSSAETSAGEAKTHGETQPPANGQSNRPKWMHRRESSFAKIRNEEERTLSTIFPGVRSLIFVPLWDGTRGRWSSSGLVVSRSPSRFFTVDGDLSFLKAFGMSVQSEINRVETMFSERAKSDMLGSLSHELRSPLHGLLGACELICETNMTVIQRDMIHMVETSGRTLLDVIDHLLDYSKINNFRHNIKRDSGDHSRGASMGWDKSMESGMISLVSDIELDLLTEEVVESVFTGHNFQRLSIAQMSHQDGSEIVDTACLKQADIASAIGNYTHAHTQQTAAAAGTYNKTNNNNSVSVYLDIDPHTVWNVVGVPGALRRIIMNVFGNALKFTDRGFVFVGLRSDTLIKGTKRRNYAILTIIDSGKGISEDFLHNQLFKPFTQEDKLSPGTGLGLSIVQQITSTLGGHIKVRSQVGKGSKFEVFLPLSLATGPPLRGEPFAEQVGALAGLRVSLLGFHDTSIAGSLVPGPITDDHVLMERICQDWLKMEVVQNPAGKDVLSELIIINDTAVDEFLEAQTGEKTLPPIVVVCQNAFKAHSLSTLMKTSRQNIIVQFISQPAGPRKLAQALVLSFSRWKEKQKRPPRPVSWPSDTEASEGASAENLTPWDDDYPAPLDLETVPSPLPRSPVPFKPETDTGDMPHVDIPPIVNQGLSEAPKIPGEHEERIAESEEEMHTPQPTTATPPPSGFLVVDDNKINVQILCSFLKKLKKVHKTAFDGQEALDTYINHPGHFKYIFMDISMPRMDGLEATRRIRAWEREQNTTTPAVIIALTGLASSEMQKEAFASGVNLFLTKPVRLKELKDVIKTTATTGTES